MCDVRRVMATAVCVGTFLLAVSVAFPADFESAWPTDVERTWVGADFWANRLQDWRISKGRLECLEARARKPMRTVHLLTCSLGRARGGFRMSVRTGLIDGGENLSANTWAGFLIGAGRGEVDYRAAALVHHMPGRGGGLIAALNGKGEVVFRDNGNPKKKVLYPLLKVQSREGTGAPLGPDSDVDLRLEAVPAGDAYDLTLSAYDHRTGKLISRATLTGVAASRLVGNVALVSHPGPKGDYARYWFRDWKVSGPKFERHDDHRFGPILCTQYTLGRNILKMTAQMPPLGDKDTQTARLEIRRGAGEPWRTVARGKLLVPSYTIPFRVENWDSSRDADYRVVYKLRLAGGRSEDCYWYGRIQRDPVDKETIVVAAFTGNNNTGIGADSPNTPRAAVRWTRNNLWFPHKDIVEHVRAHSPDLLIFTGDQVYEGRSPTEAEKKPEESAILDYLYKWYLWCWAYRGLAREIPTICMPDDHDVFHGNLWGWGGRKAPGSNHNNGGYVMSPRFVNMVQRTQTSHLPDPYDPTPVEQGITVYYTAMNYGGIGFAILEDRKFKSPPTIVPDAKIVDGHIMTIGYDVRKADVPGATLLGSRQLKFLKDWAADWKGVFMKVAVSQTIFCNLQTRDYYPDKLDRDCDSNGWPQSGRNRALRELRRGFVFMIGGDQHLASIVHHGIDDWNDAGYSFCVPSIANFYPRRWQPPKPGRNHQVGMPDYTGEYLDGFGNHITVWAVANPQNVQDLVKKGLSWREIGLHGLAPGYGIVKLNKKDRTITMECWPRKADPRNPKAQYRGWPLTVSMEDNYGRKAVAYLPTLRFVGMENPVVQVINEKDGEIVYTIRAKGRSFRPKVFASGTYTIRVGEPGTHRMKTLKNIHSIGKDEKRELEVKL